MDHEALMAEVQRVLKPGGTVVFSDIMQSDNGGDCSSFTGQNVTTKLASPQTYKARCFILGVRLSPPQGPWLHSRPAHLSCTFPSARSACYSAHGPRHTSATRSAPI